MNNTMERFPSFDMLQSEHDDLLDQQVERGETGDQVSAAFQSEVAQFIVRAQATGALLDTSHDRRAAQSILDYWANVLYRARYQPPEARLALFDPELAPALRDEDCPYQGLSAFDERSHAFFFGREALVEQMVEQLRHGQRLLFILGASGSGKSSLVRAGLVPELQAGALPGSAGWRYITIVPGAEPGKSLTDALAPLGPQQLPLAALPTVAGSNGHAQSPPQPAQPPDKAGDQPMVLVVDQFEETFTLCRAEQEQQAFADRLVELVERAQPCHLVILTMRTDHFVDKLATLPRLYELFHAARIDVEAMGIRELRAAIEKPAAKVGLKFDEGIVDNMIEKILGEGAGLPLLQFTLLKLWEQRHRNRISKAVYERVGNPLEALGRSAEHFYNSLPENQLTIKRILLKLVRPSEGMEVTSKRIPLADLFADGEARDRVERVLHGLLCTARLVKLSGTTSEVYPCSAGFKEGELFRLASQERKGGELVQIEVAHEALIRNWPRLVEWLDEERINWRRRLSVRAAAEDWARLGQDESALWSGLQLEEALHYADLDDLEQRFVAASIAQRDRAAKEQEAQRQRELETFRKLAAEAEARRLAEEQRASEANAHAAEQAAAAKRFRQIAVVAGLLAAIAVALALWAASLNQQLEQENTLTQARWLAEVALGELDSKPSSAMQHAVESIERTAPLTDVAPSAAESVLRQALATIDGRPLAAYTQTPNIATSPDGRWLATYGKSLGLELWNLASDPPQASFSALPESDIVLASAEFSPDSQWLATIYKNDEVRLWQVGQTTPTRGQFLTAKGHANGFATLAFDPHGQWLVTTDAAGNEALYALTQTTGVLTPVVHLADNSDGRMLAVFSPSTAAGRTLLVVNGDFIDRWDLRDLAKPVRQQRLPVDEKNIVEWRLDPARGRWLATLEQDGAVWLRDLREASPAPSLLLTATISSTGSIAETADSAVGKPPQQSQFVFSPDGDWLATTRGDSTIQLWQLGAAMPQSPQRQLPHQGAIREFSFSPDGKWLTVLDNAQELCRWSLVNATAEPVCVADAGLAAHGKVAFSENGRWLSVWGQNNVPQLLDLKLLADRSHPSSPLPFAAVHGHDELVTDLQINRNGQWLVTSSLDGRIRLLDLTSDWQATNPMPLTLSEPVQALAFTDNGLMAVNPKTGDLFFYQSATPEVAVTQTLPITGEPFLFRLEAGYADVLEHAQISPDLRAAFQANQQPLTAKAVVKEMTPHTAWSILDGNNKYILRLADQVLKVYEQPLPIVTVALHPLGKEVAFGNGAGVVTVWALGDSRPISSTLPAGQGAVQKLAFSADGAKLAAAWQKGGPTVWTISDLTAPGSLTIPTSYTSVTALALNPNGRWLALGAQQGLQLSALGQPGETIFLPLGSGRVASVIAFSPDNRWLAVAGDMQRKNDRAEENRSPTTPSSFIWLWRLGADGRPVAPERPVVLSGQNGPVTALAFGPKGDLLGSGSADNTVRLWDLRTNPVGQQPRLVLTDHRNALRSLAFSQDGRWLATVDATPALLLWDLQSDELTLDVNRLVAAACRATDCGGAKEPPTSPSSGEPTYCGTCGR